MKLGLIKFLESREKEDAFPTYYKLNTSKAIKKLAKINGFDIVEFNLVNSTAGTVKLAPLVIIELLIIRVLNFRLFSNLRSNIVAVLQKKS